MNAPEYAAIAAIQRRIDTLGQRDALKAAEDAAVAAIRRDLEALVAGKDLTSKVPLDRLAHVLAYGAFGAMEVPAEYVRGYRDAMARVRQALGPVVTAAADPFKAADGSED